MKLSERMHLMNDVVISMFAKEVALLEDVVEAGRVLQDEQVSYMTDGYIVEEVRLERLWRN